MKKRPQVIIEDLRQAGATVISLAKDPLNLRPAVQVIKDVLEKRTAQSGQPVCAVFAEQHRVSQHVALPLFVLSELARINPKSVGVGLERPHNLFAQHFPELDGTVTKESIISEVGSDDAGLVVIKILDKLKIVHDSAPIVNTAFQDVCLKYGVTVCFADAARTQCQKYIDPDDEDNAEFLKSAGIGENERVFVDEGLGMAIRNIVIAKNNFNHRQASGVKYQLLRHGAAHLFGEVGYDDYTDSLAHLFTKLGMDAVYILPVAKGIKERELPIELLGHAKDVIVVTGHTERRFKLGDEGQECAHLNELFYRSGYMSAEEYRAAKLEL